MHPSSPGAWLPRRRRDGRPASRRDQAVGGIAGVSLKRSHVVTVIGSSSPRDAHGRDARAAVEVEAMLAWIEGVSRAGPAGQRASCVR